MSFYTTALGIVLSLVQSLDKKKQAYQDLMDNLNLYMEDHHLPQPLRTRIRRHFRKQESSNVLFDWSFVVNKMSQSLREEVAEYTAHKWLANSRWFYDVDAIVLNVLSTKMAPVAFSKGQDIFCAASGLS